MKAIGVDWGTSNLRAFYYDDDELIAETQSSHGIRHLPEGGFEAAFEAAVAPFPSDVPVVLYGMVGANTGWREASYVDCPCTVASFAQQLIDVSDLVQRPAWLTPGVRHLGPHCVELMRGEEVQIWGVLSLYAEAQNILLPGTHSKAVQIKDQSLVQFQTAMTGELFSILRQHSILSARCPQKHSDDAWTQGLMHSMLPDRDLLSLVFQARSQMLSGRIDEAHSDSYLSGLLIGSELKDRLPEGPLYVVAAAELADLYQKAAMRMSTDCQLIVVPPVLAGHMGLRAIQEHL